MGLKLKVDKLEDVEEAHRPLYSAADGGGFQLGVDDLEDYTGALKRGKDHEVEARKKAESELRKLQDASKAATEAARKAAEEAAAKDGNIEALRKSAEERLAQGLAERDSQYKPQIDSLTSDVNRLLVDNVATTMASQIALEGSAQVLIPHITARLGVEIRDGQRVTVVKGPDGKPSASTLEDLKKEIVGNKAFAPLIAGSKGSGSGAGGSKGGSAAGAKPLSRADFNALNPAQKLAHTRGGGSVTD